MIVVQEWKLGSPNQFDHKALPMIVKRISEQLPTF